MVQEGFGNDNMLQEAAAIEQEQQSAVKLAEQKLNLLQSIILPAEMRQADLEIENRTRELESSKQLHLHSLAKQNNVLVRLRNQRETLGEARDQAKAMLDKTEIGAPVSGFVVYKTIPVSNERRKVQVGDSVWNRHGFIVLPDMSAMVGHVNIREQDIGKLEVGQPVTLQPEAYPGLVLEGERRSRRYARGRQRGSRREPVPGAHRAERSRSATAARHARESVDPGQRFVDVLRVPIEAVFYEDGEAVCFTWDDDEATQQRVTLGSSDGEYVVVEAGLDAGQRVLLTYPRQAFNSGAGE